MFASPSFSSAPESIFRWDKLAPELLRSFIYNLIIGLFLAASTPYSLRLTLGFCLPVGLSIFSFVYLSAFVCKRNAIHWFDALVGIPLGFTQGFWLGMQINGLSLVELQRLYPEGLATGIASTLLFGLLSALDMQRRHRLERVERLIHQERLRRLEQASALAQTELQLLQAQIEPHFLFNTLSNVVSLIEIAPATARSMLLDLTTLLRASLTRTRREVVRLDEELVLIRSYLNIMNIRMGSRLVWSIDAPEAVLDAEIQPLIIQPLVENAIKHGFEDKPLGGEVKIRCELHSDRLEIRVVDNGLGFRSQNAGGSGVGIGNIRKRLKARHQEAASLDLFANEAGGGITALIRMPYRRFQEKHGHR